MTFGLSPGGTFLLRAITQRLVGPPAAVYTCYKMADVYGYDRWIPQSLRSSFGLCITTIGIIGLYITVTSIWSSLQTRRACRRLGAEPLPRVKGGKWPGNLDVVIRLAKLAGEEYLADGMKLISQENGDLFLFDILWAHTVRGSEALFQPRINSFRLTIIYHLARSSRSTRTTSRRSW